MLRKNDFRSPRQSRRRLRQLRKQRMRSMRSGRRQNIGAQVIAWTVVVLGMAFVLLLINTYRPHPSFVPTPLPTPTPGQVLSQTQQRDASSSPAPSATLAPAQSGFTLPTPTPLPPTPTSTPLPAAKPGTVVQDMTRKHASLSIGEIDGFLNAFLPAHTHLLSYQLSSLEAQMEAI